MKFRLRALSFGILLTALLAIPQIGCTDFVAGPADAPGEIAIDDLPAEARVTLGLIEAGGPFPYDKDGSVFHNYEGLLPQKPDGYYREYTVETPGSPDRGALRVVAGSNEERYYTDDHYESFRLIVE